MTITEFFKKLPRTGWYLTAEGRLRRKRGGRKEEQCPLTAVSGGCVLAPISTCKLDLPYDTVTAIIIASDNCLQNAQWPLPRNTEKMRKRLLAHCLPRK